MSKGMPIEDWERTKSQLKKSNPCRNGKTWLRHLENAQSGRIDLMVLEGEYSTEDMGHEIDRLKLWDPKKPYEDRMKRVESHLGHLQNKPPRGTPHTEPHGLKLMQVNGKWRFNL